MITQEGFAPLTVSFFSRVQVKRERYGPFFPTMYVLLLAYILR